MQRASRLPRDFARIVEHNWGRVFAWQWDERALAAGMYLPDQWPESRLDEWLERRNAQGLGGPHRSYIDKLAAVLDRDRDLTGAKPLDWTCGASFTGRRLSGEDAVDMVCEELVLI
ncbi:hypothetical protein PLESTM_000146500 [Pleodorina starrii]|nr:hypothetical protein PLESTM_000146500 [Pleodorina starrii]